MTRLCISKDQNHAKHPDGRRFLFIPEGTRMFEDRRAKCDMSPTDIKCWWCGLRRGRYTFNCNGNDKSHCVSEYRIDGLSGIWVAEEP